NASGIAAKVDNVIPKIRVKAVCSDVLLVLSDASESPVAEQQGSTGAHTQATQRAAANIKWNESVEQLKKIVAMIDVGNPAPFVSNHVLRLYNNRNGAEVAAAVADKAVGANEEIKKVGDDELVITGVPAGREVPIEETARYVALLDIPRPQ